jgi:dolichyl-diphosphooligosaccharide--protein glycosyltransferase
VHTWRSGDRRSALLAATWLLVFLVFSLARRRFAMYLAPPLALVAGAGLVHAARRLRGAARAAAPVVAAVLLALPAYGALTGPHAVKGVDELAPALAWLRDEPRTANHEAVLADWDLGHLVRYFARRPVVVSPFGIDGGDGAMEDASRFYLAEDERTAEDLLRDRGVGYLVVQNPPGVVYIAEGFVAAPEHVKLRSRSAQVFAFEGTPRFADLVLARLYFLDGAATRRSPALGGFRLVYETPPTDPGPPPVGAFRIYERVRGAIVRVAAAPGGVARARVEVVSNTGRRFTWATAAAGNERGFATFRVPYATGGNGAVSAGPCLVDVGAGTRAVEIPDDAVRSGIEVAVAP